MLTETAPTFLMSGNRIVEVYYTEWESLNGAAWSLKQPTTFEVDHHADGMVVELPIGCFSLAPFVTYPGDTLTMEHTGRGRSLDRCHRPRMFAEPSEVTVPA